MKQHEDQYTRRYNPEDASLRKGTCSLFNISVEGEVERTPADILSAQSAS
jgi:hypothetical protein